MSKQRAAYKTFPREFKLEAVRLMEASDRPASEIAMELGIRRNQLYKWKDQLREKGDEAFTRAIGRPRKEEQSEVTTLKSESGSPIRGLRVKGIKNLPPPSGGYL